jgi:leader peptidase (prepilin peptidase)/N-methyltransferase
MEHNLFNSLNIIDLSVWYDLPLYVQYILVVIFGLCIGSFINVVIYRLPLIFEQELQEYLAEQANAENDESEIKKTDENVSLSDKEQELKPAYLTEKITLSKPASRCSNCNYVLRWYDNIPVFSWLFLKAKCRNCDTSISIQYPLVEVIAGLGTLLCFMLFNNAYQAFCAILFFWLLLTITVLDAKTQLLPNELSQPLIFLGLFCGANNLFVDASTAIYGFLFGFFILWIVAFLFKLIRGYEGLGSGDPYLLGGIGAFVGIENSLYTIFFASILGILYVVLRKLFASKDMSTAIPFGPFISCAGFVMFLYANHKIGFLN